MVARIGPKRRQHHVWQKYLSAWANDGGIWCSQHGKVFQTGTRELAVEKYFYRIPDLNKTDIELLDIFLKTTDSISEESNRQLVGDLINPILLGKSLLQYSNDPQSFNSELDTYKINTLEDYHMRIESSFIPILEELHNGSTNFYLDDSLSPHFFNFLATQHLRTKGVKERSLSRIKDAGVGFNFSKIWGLLAILLARNVGLSLYRERKSRTIQIIKNTQSVPFITGDQPIINLSGGLSKSTNTPPNHLVWFYPISPTKALVLSECDEQPPLSTNTLTVPIIRDLNNKMRNASHFQVFGASKRGLKETS